MSGNDGSSRDGSSRDDIWQDELPADDLLIQVVDSFKRMPVQPGPTVAETIELVARADRREAFGVRSPEKLPPRSRGAWQRMAVAGVGVAAVIALVVIALNSAKPLSAMERMARQLRAVESYRYVVSTKTTSVDGATTSTWVGEGPTYWRAPDAFREEMKIVETVVSEGSDERREEVLEDFVQVFPAGKPGILIDHKRKEYFLQSFDPTGSRTYPLEMLKLIREEEVAATRELGTRPIQGKQARGYIVPLTTGDPPRQHDVEVWIDPATDLPLEFGYRVDDDQQPRTTTEFRVTDFRWNAELDPKLFDVSPPTGYVERSAPRSQ